MKARFCACPAERFKAGRAVFMKAPGVLTTVEAEAGRAPVVVGVIDTEGRLKLCEGAERTLAAAA